MRSKINITIRLIAIIFVGTLFSEVKAQNPETLLQEANALYNNNAYDSAAVVYESIINKGYSSAELYYNLGNTYYKLRNYPLAILYYEKSLKLDPQNEDTKHNIEIAQMFITDKIEPIPEFFLKNWWNIISDNFTLNTWAIITIVIFFLLLLTVFLYITAKSKAMRKVTFFVGITFIILTICSFTISIQKYNYYTSHNEGIIISPTITVKSSPSETSVDLFVLHEGSKVKILDQTDDWNKIKIANGSIGWLPSSTIIRY